MTGSTVPAAVDGLVAAFTVALAGDPVTVVDGPPPGDYGDSVLCVAYTASDEGDAVTAAAARADAAMARDRETYEVACLLSVAHGDVDPAGVRNEAFGYLEKLRAALAGDPSLDDAVDRADLTGYGYSPELADGSIANIPFTVTVTAWRS